MIDVSEIQPQIPPPKKTKLVKIIKMIAGTTDEVSR